jgi:hypothetical protein
VLLKALSSGCAGGCEALQYSKLAPAPKPQAAQQPAILDCYRSIWVESVVGRVSDHILQRRLDVMVEREGIRAYTQCGFRGQHGCLDALCNVKAALQTAAKPVGDIRRLPQGFRPCATRPAGRPLSPDGCHMAHSWKH